jgi:hypothetical protein
MVAIKRGESEVTEGDQLTLDVRRDCDAEYLRRAEVFIRRTVRDGTPFFVYFNHSLMHMPVIPRQEFKGRSGQGDWADSLLELDADFGALLDLLNELGVAKDTLVVFAGDNGPEDVLHHGHHRRLSSWHGCRARTSRHLRAGPRRANQSRQQTGRHPLPRPAQREGPVPDRRSTAGHLASADRRTRADRPDRGTSTRGRTVLAPRPAAPMVGRTTAALPRVAALLAWLAGVGFGLPGVYAIWYFARYRSVWTFLGYPTYGDGPFEDAGIATTVPLLVSFLLVCLAEVVAGWLLWRNHPTAPIVSLVLLPLEFAFWIGFALPAGPLLGLTRTALVLPALFRSHPRSRR